METLEDEFQEMIVKLFCNDVRFAKEYGLHIPPDLLDNQFTKTLFFLAKAHFTKYEYEITQGILKQVVGDYALKNNLNEQIKRDLIQHVDDIFMLDVESKKVYIKDHLLRVCAGLDFKKRIEESMMMFEKTGDANKALQLVRDAPLKIGVDDGVSFSDSFKLIKMWQSEDAAASKVPTGFPTIDEALKGGMGAKELHILLGITGVGKSSIAVNIGASNFVKGKKVFHCSFELTREQVLKKYVCRMTDMRDYELIKPENQRKVEDKLIDIKKRIADNLFINSWDMYEENCNVIKSWISKIRAEKNLTPDLIIIDYDDLVLPIGEKSSERWQDATKVYKDFIGLSRYFNCAILVISQAGTDGLRQQATTGKLSMAEISGARQKLKDASSVITINYDKNLQGEDLVDSGDVSSYLFLEKARFGRDKVKAYLQKDLSKCKVVEVK